MSAIRHAGSAVRYASRTTGVNFEKYLVWGAIGGIAYLLYKTYSVGAAISDAATKTGEAIGSGLFELIRGAEVRRALAPNLIVSFPDGQFHQVPTVKVDDDGRFVNRNLAPNYAGDGKRYQLVKLKVPVTRNGITTSNGAVLV